MNSSTLKAALSAGKSAWDRYSDFRDQKVSDAYDALVNAADSYDDVAKDVKKNVSKATKNALGTLDDKAQDAGALTKDARRRIEKALKEARESSKNYVQDAVDAQESAALNAKKMSKRTRKKALAAGRKAADKAQKRVDQLTSKDKKRTKRNWTIAIIVAAVAALGGGAYFFASQRKKEEPADRIPPRVDDYATPEPDVPTDAATANHPADAHDPSAAKREGEELLASLDEQLERHRAEAETAPAEEEHGPKHRLVEPAKGNLDEVVLEEPVDGGEMLAQDYERKSDNSSRTIHANEAAEAKETEAAGTADARATKAAEKPESAPATGPVSDAEAQEAARQADANDARDIKGDLDEAAKRQAQQDGRA